MDWNFQERIVLERCRGVKGEIQLQRRGNEYEIIYNGVFLMASYNGISERALVSDALKMVNRGPGSHLGMLMGGLGMGFSLQEALACKEVKRVVVAEIEPAVIRWNRDYLGKLNNGAVNDSRVEIVNIDFIELIKEKAAAASRDPARAFQVVMVDTDNGSSWLSIPSNDRLYREGGLNLIKKCLSPGGVACFWSAKKEEDFEQRLRTCFHEVHFRRAEEKTGQESAYYLACKDSCSS